MRCCRRVAGKRVGVEFVGARVVHVGGVLLQFADDPLQLRDQRADRGRNRNAGADSRRDVTISVAVPPVGPLTACCRAVGGVGAGVELGAAFGAGFQGGRHGRKSNGYM